MKYKKLKYDTFLEFYNDALPSGNLGKYLQGFIFRGESSNKRKLVPSALREENKWKLWNKENIPINNQSEMEMWQIKAEYNLLREFYRVSNYNGLKVPYIESMRKNYLDFFDMEREISRNAYKWIEYELVELTVNSQH